MREILFRAKTEPNCKSSMTGKIIKKPKWIYGYIDLGYMHDCKTALIGDEKGNNVYKCQYETIGQYTGLTDKNGTKIFEGDIVHLTDVRYNNEWKAVVVFGNPYSQYSWGWNLQYIGKKPQINTDILLWVEMEDVQVYCEVIGNIHDNPELLKGGEG